jgi:hypothetical protein
MPVKSIDEVLWIWLALLHLFVVWTVYVAGRRLGSSVSWSRSWPSLPIEMITSSKVLTRRREYLSTLLNRCSSLARGSCSLSILAIRILRWRITKVVVALIAVDLAIWTNWSFLASNVREIVHHGLLGCCSWSHTTILVWSSTSDHDIGLGATISLWSISFWLHTSVSMSAPCNIFCMMLLLSLKN